jgi:hypothetical protein
LALFDPLAHPVARDLPRGGVDAVESVDGGDRDYERGQLRLVVVSCRLLLDVVRHRVRPVRDPGRGFGQRPRGPLGLGEVRGFSTGGDRVDAFLGFARMREFAGVDATTVAVLIAMAPMLG